MPKAVLLTKYGDPDVLVWGDVPMSDPGPGQVRIRVKAAGVSPTDPKIRRGDLEAIFPLPPDAVLGFEAAGVVDALGPSVSGVAEGDEVAALLLDLGGYGEYVVASSWTLKPPNVSWSDAAALPASAEAAVRILKQLEVSSGETLLILGAAGSVGMIATQLAVSMGVRVIGAAAPRDHDVVRTLGAVPVSYGPRLAENVRECVRSVDAVLDAAGKGELPAAIALAGGPGRVMTLADEQAAVLGVGFSAPTPGGAPEALDLTMPLLASGALHLRRQRHLPMENAVEAHRLLESGEAHEKLILDVDRELWGMTDASQSMSMFDYDARPITPQVVLVGNRSSSVGYNIRDFLSRNGIPYEWVEVDDSERLGDLLTPEDLNLGRLPLCILPDGNRLAPANVEDVAAGLGMVSAPALSEYDLTIVGAGPAGLAAAVYGASEGLRALTIEGVAPGGQAGTTSMIENYLGFPQGISGSELATRATAQARRFGAEVVLARRLVDLSKDGPGYLATLSDGAKVRSRAMLVASGVDWRRLEIAGLDDLLGSGVYYGAGPSEAVTCSGCQIVVVGGGNSAGQAVIRFSRYAAHVTLLVRGSSLETSMSQYLISQVNKLDNVEIRTSSEVVALEADTHLEALMVSSGGSVARLPTDALFVCIGGVPRTDGMVDVGLALDSAGYVRTGAGVSSSAGALDQWGLPRQPLPLETNLPGLFAAGDVRSGSIKRCAAAIGEGSMAVALVHQRLAEVGGE